MLRRVFRHITSGYTQKTCCAHVLECRDHLCLPKGFCTDQQDDDILKKYKSVMRNVPQSVVVVTTAKHVASKNVWLKRGMTCSSFTSVSLKPPVISFAINNPSRMHDILLETKQFAVHILAKDQVRYGVTFSKPPVNSEDQFVNIPHEQDENGLPIINNASHVLKCTAHSVNTVGDHHVWYGNVTQAHSTVGAQEPMIYYLRSFRSIGDETFIQAFEDRSLPFEDWTHEAHLRMSWNYIKEYGREEAVPHIINGILRYNEKNKERINRGYHETVTQFYIHMVADAVLKCDHPDITFEEFIGQNEYLAERNLLFKYYSEPLINTKEAKSGFVQPDIQSLP